MHKTHRSALVPLLLAFSLAACEDPSSPAGAAPTPPVSSGASGASGSSGDDPPSTPPCEAPTTFVASQDDVMDTAVDATHVYWTIDPSHGTDGKLLAAAKSGGAPQTLVDGIKHPRGVVADGSRVFWITYSEGVWSAPRGGGAPTQHHPDSSTTAARGLAVDATHLYWTSTHGVVSLPKDAPPGTDPTPLISDAGGSLALSDGYLYATSKHALWRVKPGSDEPAQMLLDKLTSVDAVAVRDSTVYLIDVTEPNVGRLLAVPVSGGSPKELASKLDVPSSAGLDVDETHVYLTTLAELARVPRGGGPRQGLFCQGGAALRLDSDAAYWAGPTGRGLFRGEK